MLSFKLAIKYLFSKKKYGVINLILWLAASVTILVGMAMVVVLSTFNGIEGLVLSLYQSLEPPYRIEHVNQDIVQLSSTQLNNGNRNGGTCKSGPRSGKGVLEFIHSKR